MTVIGLTGGIASGKSTASEMLREQGATIIDADRLGHRSYEPGTQGFQKVVNAFGHDIVGKDGVIDRRVLGGKVFGAPEQIARLNGIVWPEIRRLILDEVKQIRAQDPGAIIVLEAAVLLEAGWQDLCDEIWVVTTPTKVAVDRLKTRNNLSEDASMARINSQMTNKERSDVADVKIENAGTEDQLRQRVERCWKALESRLGRKTKRAPKKAPTGKPTARKKSGAKKPAAKPAASKTVAASSKTATSKAAAKPAVKPAPAKPTAGKSASKPAAAPARAAAAKKAGAATTTKPAAKAAASKAPAAKAAAPKAGKATAKIRASASTGGA
ncbi:MAG: dephospho-CoA kinase, partial [Dehalococcoidia bacterium]